MQALVDMVEVRVDFALSHTDLFRDLPRGQRVLPEKGFHALSQGVCTQGRNRGWISFHRLLSCISARGMNFTRLIAFLTVPGPVLY